jgi:hypothetical protein
MRTEAELRAFKDEMRIFREESEGDRKAMHEETRVFKGEACQIIREMNMQWGAMAKKMGTMTEDLVAPSIPRIVREEFGLELESFGIRQRRRLPDGRTKEYDAVGAAGDLVFLDSTKSTLDALDINDFVKDILVFRDFFPESREKKLIGILATLRVEENVLKHAEKEGLLVLGVGDQLLEVKNTKGFKPKEW